MNNQYIRFSRYFNTLVRINAFVRHPVYTIFPPRPSEIGYVYDDDLALLHFSADWKSLKGALSQDMATLLAYLKAWRLKLSYAKTVTAAFHLHNREAKRKLKVYVNCKLLLFFPVPTKLGVKLDRSLTFLRHCAKTI